MCDSFPKKISVHWQYPESEASGLISRKDSSGNDTSSVLAPIPFAGLGLRARCPQSPNGCVTKSLHNWSLPAPASTKSILIELSLACYAISGQFGPHGPGKLAMPEKPKFLKSQRLESAGTFEDVVDGRPDAGTAEPCSSCDCAWAIALRGRLRIPGRSRRSPVSERTAAIFLPAFFSPSCGERRHSSSEVRHLRHSQ
jgi:hypothetical protein